MPQPVILPLSGDPDADRFLSTDPLALLIGMLLDQQVPMERAFHSPYDLRERLGRLDALDMAGRDPDELARAFRTKPALHRFPDSMAARVQALCRHLVDEYDGRADRVWSTARHGKELYARVRALPGFGEMKARTFVALLGKRLGVTPPGWEQQAADWASVADIDSPEALAHVREAKRAMRAEKIAAATPGPGKRAAKSPRGGPGGRGDRGGRGSPGRGRPGVGGSRR
jgi:uncharacterized HhH-GPD family protein